ncbi:MarR family winged helix-turn-helix transcriptional regulator [Planococcus lenghuensis]|uniref:MarR family transcriptional regulator n=1 Tax=Planococcus lenghuensis TaxID=2213202 RepID=A0A1Q2KWE3_9BACL|nr:MarR family transcriptional regulator [Planococcus lenghuensis]AQQ51992.1 MarR family transcriptional regulator [Planococcus lenghuensis]
MPHQLFHEIHQKARLSAKEVNEALKEYGLFSSQWGILTLLDRRGAMSQTAIWQYLNVEAPTVTRTLARLEETGWVVRKKGRDKRERMAYLTEKAKQLLPEISVQVSKLEAELTAELTEQEQQQLLLLLKKIKSGQEEKEGSDD